MVRRNAHIARLGAFLAVLVAAVAIAACGSSSKSSSSSTSGAAGSGSSSSSSTSGGSGGSVKIGVDLTYNDTAFWAAYINYESQFAKQMGISLIGPKVAGASAATQNQQIEDLVNEGAKAIIVNPETATSLTPAIAYAAQRHVQLISVDTIVGAGKVYMVVRANNSLYGQDACNYIIGKGVKSGYVLNLQGDLTSSNGSDRSNAFTQCMSKNDPGVTVLSKPTVWTTATAVTDTQAAVNSYGSKLGAIYSPWSGPTPAVVKLLASKGLKNTLYIDDDGVPFDMCNVSQGTQSASQSQPADQYAKYALTYAKDAAQGTKLSAGQAGASGAKLVNATFGAATNLEDPIVAPFVTKTAETFTLKTAVAGLSPTLTTTPVSTASLWGNVYGKAHGGVCSTAASS